MSSTWSAGRVATYAQVNDRQSDVLTTTNELDSDLGLSGRADIASPAGEEQESQVGLRGRTGTDGVNSCGQGSSTELRGDIIARRDTTFLALDRLGIPDVLGVDSDVRVDNGSDAAVLGPEGSE